MHAPPASGHTAPLHEPAHTRARARSTLSRTDLTRPTLYAHAHGTQTATHASPHAPQSHAHAHTPHTRHTAHVDARNSAHVRAHARAADRAHRLYLCLCLYLWSQEWAGSTHGAALTRATQTVPCERARGPLTRLTGPCCTRRGPQACRPGRCGSGTRAPGARWRLPSAGGRARCTAAERTRSIRPRGSSPPPRRQATPRAAASGAARPSGRRT
mmetsp:Transcript_20791/g.35607  ORF Transcript_20791/g.35607 Transcript_20791/m.35607 type:complete len:214 (-) Transcript_20791:935-1576(-)